jgi:TatD DNase family protein
MLVRCRRRRRRYWTPLEIIDSHAHLEYPQFDEDRDAMLQRAREAGVATILAIGGAAGPDHLASAIPFAEAHDWIYATAGIHPHEANLATDSHFADLEKLTHHPRFLAVGEIGLDYFHNHSPREIQATVFRRQLDIARAAKKPIVIHCRDAWTDCLTILESHWLSAGLGGILHCFTGTPEEARKGIELGFLVSFAANITYPKNSALRDTASELPLDRILTETDSPYLAPQRARGKRNEPAYVAEVAQTLANVRKSTTEEVAAATAANFRRFFRLGDT